MNFFSNLSSELKQFRFYLSLFLRICLFSFAVYQIIIYFEGFDDRWHFKVAFNILLFFIFASISFNISISFSLSFLSFSLILIMIVCLKMSDKYRLSVYGQKEANFNIT